MQIITHVVFLHLHVVTKLVKGRSTDHVAFAINLPGDGGILRAHLVTAGVTGGGSGVSGDILAHSQFWVNNPSSNHIGVVILIVVDNSENLSLNSNSAGNVL